MYTRFIVIKYTVVSLGIKKNVFDLPTSRKTVFFLDRINSVLSVIRRTHAHTFDENKNKKSCTSTRLVGTTTGTNKARTMRAHTCLRFRDDPALLRKWGGRTQRLIITAKHFQLFSSAGVFFETKTNIKRNTHRTFFDKAATTAALLLSTRTLSVSPSSIVTRRILFGEVPKTIRLNRLITTHVHTRSAFFLVWQKKKKLFLKIFLYPIREIQHQTALHDRQHTSVFSDRVTINRQQPVALLFNRLD